MAEARKTVTIVFADVSGSTELGERLDPEAMRRVMDRYFAEARIRRGSLGVPHRAQHPRYRVNPSKEW